MSSIFKEVTLNWKGQEYSVTPDMRLINSIENEISLSRLAIRAEQGDVPVSQLATVYSRLLKAAGCIDATPEKVYEAMFSHASNDLIMSAVQIALQAFFPSNGEVAEKKS